MVCLYSSSYLQYSAVQLLTNCTFCFNEGIVAASIYISFSMVTLVAHLNKALTYLYPAKYIPAKKTRWAIIIKRGPPMIISKGSRQ